MCICICISICNSTNNTRNKLISSSFDEPLVAAGAQKPKTPSSQTCPNPSFQCKIKQRYCSVYSGNAQDLKWINERTIAATSRKRIDTAIVFPQPHFITIRLVLIVEQGLHCVFQFAEPIFDQIKCEGLQSSTFHIVFLAK